MTSCKRPWSFRPAWVLRATPFPNRTDKHARFRRTCRKIPSPAMKAFPLARAPTLHRVLARISPRRAPMGARHIIFRRVLQDDIPRNGHRTHRKRSILSDVEEGAGRAMVQLRYSSFDVRSDDTAYPGAGLSSNSPTIFSADCQRRLSFARRAWRRAVSLPGRCPRRGGGRVMACEAVGVAELTRRAAEESRPCPDLSPACRGMHALFRSGEPGDGPWNNRTKARRNIGMPEPQAPPLSRPELPLCRVARVDGGSSTGRVASPARSPKTV